jgi:hypothetical protein
MLSPSKVNTIYEACRFQNDETINEADVATADGIRGPMAFSRARLEERVGDIVAMLRELPESFQRPIGDSFVNAYIDRGQSTWATCAEQVNQLIQLGAAVGKILYLTPARTWRFPNSPPLFRIYL